MLQKPKRRGNDYSPYLLLTMLLTIVAIGLTAEIAMWTFVLDIGVFTIFFAMLIWRSKLPTFLMRGFYRDLLIVIVVSVLTFLMFFSISYGREEFVTTQIGEEGFDYSVTLETRNEQQDFSDVHALEKRLYEESLLWNHPIVEINRENVTRYIANVGLITETRIEQNTTKLEIFSIILKETSELLQTNPSTSLFSPQGLYLFTPTGDQDYVKEDARGTYISIITDNMTAKPAGESFLNLSLYVDRVLHNPKISTPVLYLPIRQFEEAYDMSDKYAGFSQIKSLTVTIRFFSRLKERVLSKDYSEVYNEIAQIYRSVISNADPDYQFIEKDSGFYHSDLNLYYEILLFEDIDRILMVISMTNILLFGIYFFNNNVGENSRSYHYLKNMGAKRQQVIATIGARAAVIGIIPTAVLLVVAAICSAILPLTSALFGLLNLPLILAGILYMREMSLVAPTGQVSITRIRVAYTALLLIDILPPISGNFDTLIFSLTFLLSLIPVGIIILTDALQDRINMKPRSIALEKAVLMSQYVRYVRRNRFSPVILALLVGSIISSSIIAPVYVATNDDKVTFSVGSDVNINGVVSENITSLLDKSEDLMYTRVVLVESVRPIIAIDIPSFLQVVTTGGNWREEISKLDTDTKYALRSDGDGVVPPRYKDVGEIGSIPGIPITFERHGVIPTFTVVSLEMFNLSKYPSDLLRDIILVKYLSIDADTELRQILTSDTTYSSFTTIFLENQILSDEYRSTLYLGFTLLSVVAGLFALLIVVRHRRDLMILWSSLVETLGYLGVGENQLSKIHREFEMGLTRVVTGVLIAYLAMSIPLVLAIVATLLEWLVNQFGCAQLLFPLSASSALILVALFVRNSDAAAHLHS